MKKRTQQEEWQMQTANGMNKKLRAAMLVSFIIMIAGIIGCSSTPPIGPQDDSLLILNSLGLDPNADGWDELTNPDSEGLARVYFQVSDVALNVVPVGVFGGTIEMSLGSESSTLYVPSGALKEPVEIGAEAVLLVSGRDVLRLFDFSPDGLIFLRPAVLTLDTDLPPNTVLKLYYLNPNTGRWQLEQAAVTNGDGVVIFNIKHFSKYAIS